MPRGNKKIGERRRKVCTCKAFDCESGFYLDAQGSSQPGVELSPEAYEAHQQSELRNIARAASSVDALEHSFQDINFGSSSKDNPLVEILRELRVSPASQSSPSRSGEAVNPAQVPNRSSREHDKDAILKSSRTCPAIDTAREVGIKVYDTENFFAFNLRQVNPVCLHVALTTAIISIFEHASMFTASWLLDAQRITIELALTHGLLSNASPGQLEPLQAKVLNQIPKTVDTVIGWLEIDPRLQFVNCCKGCFAMYPLASAPKHCTHRVADLPGAPIISEDAKGTSTPPIPEDEYMEKTCGELLVRFARGRDKPVRKYAFQNLLEWIARLLSRPLVEEWLDESLEQSSKPFDPQEMVSDIHQSKLWKAFRGPDGKQFTSQTGNMTFGMFVDGINPFGNKQSGRHSSITFVVLVCLTLPPRVRFRRENIFLVGVAPGPREPSLEQMNWILRPVVTQLKELWNPGLFLSRTRLYKKGRHIRAALLPFIADIPAVRRSLGFPSATATHFCSFCLLQKKDIKNFNQAMWPLRTCEKHRLWAYQARDASTPEERSEIFKSHGVRYSVLLELEYWDISKYHVVDSMHNLLLGLLNWHCRRFWSMKDEMNEEAEAPAISTKELMSLLAEHSQTEHHPRPSPKAPLEEDRDSDQENILDGSFDEDTASSDYEFNPFADAEWNGKWMPPPSDEIILDSTMLHQINLLLPRIRIPSWIKQAIPVLGKASFGKLKADEWRNLFTIQLPLILIPLWSGRDHIKMSLLKNFCHLVSLVNLALKRELDMDTISRYRHHIQQYLEGSIEMFQHCQPAPNHHMAIHLADCLENFGPVRSWWSFPYERLMGNIIKGTHNNHQGELEVTFVKNFCRAGNLSVLLQEDKVPESLDPFIARVQAYFDPKKPSQKKASNSKLQSLDNKSLTLLVQRLNEGASEDCEWVAPDLWVSYTKDGSVGFAVCPARAMIHNHVMHKDVTFSTVKANMNNSIIGFKSHSNGMMQFGRISSIFTHRRSPKPEKQVIETWLRVQIFPSLKKEVYNPFTHIKEPDVQTHLRMWSTNAEEVIRLDEVIAHCSWLMYQPGELHKDFKLATIALVSMER